MSNLTHTPESGKPVTQATPNGATKLNGATPAVGRTLEGFESTERYIKLMTALDSAEDVLRWRRFVDRKLPKGKTRARKNLVGPLAEVWSTLNDGNRDEGIASYLVCNRGGTTKPEMTTVRAFFIDIDGTHELSDMVWHQQPHFVVKRDHNHFHAYWLTRPYDVSVHFADTQTRLAKFYGTDGAVALNTQVMRLPGLPHKKNLDTPHDVTLIEMACGDRPGSEQEVNRTGFAGGSNS